MLTSSELKSYAHMRRIKHIDQAWKDYLQDLTLHLLYKKYPQILFRGDTCIWKVMRGNRFSEDLDLCLEKIPDNIDIYLVKELKLFGFTCAINKRKQTANMLFLQCDITSSAHLREITLFIEILASKKCTKHVKKLTLYSPYPDIPPIEVQTPNEEDIILDKISAIFKRNKEDGGGKGRRRDPAAAPGREVTDFRAGAFAGAAAGLRPVCMKPS